MLRQTDRQKAGSSQIKKEGGGKIVMNKNKTELRLTGSGKERVNARESHTNTQTHIP